MIKLCLSQSPTRLLPLRLPTALSDSTASLLLQLLKRIRGYSKADQCLDQFMMKCVETSAKFSALWRLFKILLILLHGQAQDKHRCSVNKNLHVENQHTTTFTAQCSIHDHMVHHELESSNVTITAKLLSHVKQACSRYFYYQKESSMQRIQSGKDVRR